MNARRTLKNNKNAKEIYFQTYNKYCCPRDEKIVVRDMEL